jgi:proteasome lid subunit RPN8/RPN11
MDTSDHGGREAGGERPAPAMQECRAWGSVPEGVLGAIVRHAERGYPDEVCGIVIGRPGAPETYQVRPVPNLAHHERQEDPSGHLRDARTSYKMDPLEQLRILREADVHGWEAVLFYHSHPDHGAYFSAMDSARALTPDGEPLWPGATYLVVSVMNGRARAASQHVWDAGRRGFDARPVRLSGDEIPCGQQTMTDRETPPVAGLR